MQQIDSEKTIKKAEVAEDNQSSDEEYDPAKPNDYQKIIQKHREQSKEADTKRKILERYQKQEQEMQQTAQVAEKKVNLDVSAEEAFRARLMRSKGANAKSQKDKVKRMMANMGWTEGKGLGR